MKVVRVCAVGLFVFLGSLCFGGLFKVLSQPDTPSITIVSFLCDAPIPLQAIVWENQIHKHAPPGTAILLLTFHDISNNHNVSLHYTHILRVELPTELTTSDAQQQCRLARLLLYKLEKYSQLLFVDLNALVLDDIKELFVQPSSISNTHQILPTFLTTGVWRLAPNKDLYSQLARSVQSPAYRSAAAPITGMSLHPLAFKYTAQSNYLYFGYDRAILNAAAIVQFTSEVRPWNYFTVGHTFPRALEQNYDQSFYFRWWGLQRESESFDYNAAGVLPSERCRSLVDAVPSRPPDRNCTVLFSHFVASRHNLLRNKVIPSYLRFPFVSSVVIGIGGSATFDCGDRAQLRCYPLRSSSFTARFSLVEYAKTDCIIIADDDLVVNRQGLQYMYRAWLDRPSRMVGMYAREWGPHDTYVYRGGASPKLLYDIRTPARRLARASPHSRRKNQTIAYSFVLTKSLFVHADLIRSFVCALPKEVYAVIDYYNQCEDIALNLLSLGMGRGCPVHYGLQTTDYGTRKDNLGGLSTKSNHLDIRSMCLRELLTVFKLHREEHQCYGATLLTRAQSFHASASYTQ